MTPSPSGESASGDWLRVAAHEERTLGKALLYVGSKSIQAAGDLNAMLRPPLSLSLSLTGSETCSGVARDYNRPARFTAR